MSWLTLKYKINLLVFKKILTYICNSEPPLHKSDLNGKFYILQLYVPQNHYKEDINECQDLTILGVNPFVLIDPALASPRRPGRTAAAGACCRPRPRPAPR